MIHNICVYKYQYVQDCLDYEGEKNTFYVNYVG